MDEITDLIRRADAYASRSGLKPSTVSRKLLGNGIRLNELRNGKSLRVDTLENAKRELARLESAA